MLIYVIFNFKDFYSFLKPFFYFNIFFDIFIDPYSNNQFLSLTVDEDSYGTSFFFLFSPYFFNSRYIAMLFIGDQAGSLLCLSLAKEITNLNLWMNSKEKTYFFLFSKQVFLQ